jgi:hypothetical protein
MKFSIILPVNKNVLHIETTVNSIINAVGLPANEFECIIVASNARKYIKNKYKEFSLKCPNIKYYEINTSDKNENAELLDFGKTVSKGKYIMFFEPNYELNENTISGVCDFLDANNEYDFYVGNRKVNSQTWTYDGFGFDLYGPLLHCCVFRKSSLLNTQFIHTSSNGIIFTKILLMNGLKYYYNKRNLAISSYFDECILDTTKNLYDKYPTWEGYIVSQLQSFSDYRFCLNDKNEIIEKIYKPIPMIDVYLTNICNLKCASCSAFCPLVDDGEFVPLEKVEKDFQSIVRFRDNFTSLLLVGGECTLHPQIESIMVLARKCFPNNEVCLITNGTTYKDLYKLRDTIITNKIMCVVSQYPLPNLNEIVDTYDNLIPKQQLVYQKHAIEFGFYYKHLMTGTHNEVDKILQCVKRTVLRLHDNKIYLCHYADEIKALINRFGDRIKVNDEGTYIELDENTKLEDLIHLKDEVIPELCYHCEDVLQEDTCAKLKYWETVPWKRSEKVIEEFYKE